MRTLKERVLFPAISAVVILILGTQAVAGFVDTGRWGWPILAYPMYMHPHYDGERIEVELKAFAVLADGNKIAIAREELDWSFWIYWYNVIQPIRHGRLDVLQPLISKYCQEHDSSVVELIAEDIGIAISRHGPIYGLPPITIYSTGVACD